MISVLVFLPSLEFLLDAIPGVGLGGEIVAVDEDEDEDEDGADGGDGVDGVDDRDGVDGIDVGGLGV